MSEGPTLLIVEDMLERIDNILLFTKDMSLDVYKSDLKTKNAVERNLEIIGEAANRLPNNFTLAHNEIE